MIKKKKNQTFKYAYYIVLCYVQNKKKMYFYLTISTRDLLTIVNDYCKIYK